MLMYHTVYRKAKDNSWLERCVSGQAGFRPLHILTSFLIGLINDPDRVYICYNDVFWAHVPLLFWAVDETYKINKGLRVTRQLYSDLTSRGIPVAVELLDTIRYALIFFQDSAVVEAKA